MSDENISVGAEAPPIDSNAQVLLQLAERCLHETPNLLLRADIAKALGWREVDHDCHIRYIDPDGRMRWLTETPDWPGSLDAAVTLQPDGQWGISWDIESVFAKGFEGNVAICAYVWTGRHCRSLKSGHLD